MKAWPAYFLGATSAIAVMVFGVILNEDRHKSPERVIYKEYQTERFSSEEKSVYRVPERWAVVVKKERELIDRKDPVFISPHTFYVSKQDYNSLNVGDMVSSNIHKIHPEPEEISPRELADYINAHRATDSNLVTRVEGTK